MKLIFMIMALMATSIFASPCLQVQDSLDREYCFKKELRAESAKYNSQWESYKGGLTPQRKAEVLKGLDAQLQISKEQLANLTQKRAQIEKLRQNVMKVKAPVAAAPKKKKKKRNKLKDKLRKLGIKL